MATHACTHTGPLDPPLALRNVRHTCRSSPAQWTAEDVDGHAVLVSAEFGWCEVITHFDEKGEVEHVWERPEWEGAPDPPWGEVAAVAGVVAKGGVTPYDEVVAAETENRKLSPVRFQVIRSRLPRRQRWHWRVVAVNNRVLASSENYTNEADCRDAIRLVQASAFAARVDRRLGRPESGR